MWLDEVDREKKVGADVEKVGKVRSCRAWLGVVRYLDFFFSSTGSEKTFKWFFFF